MMCSKHGLTVLALPNLLHYTDLTICMDVEQNPVWTQAKEHYYTTGHIDYNCHIDYITKKAIKRLFSIRILKKSGVTQSQLVRVFTTTIRPIVEYAKVTQRTL